MKLNTVLVAVLLIGDTLIAAECPDARRRSVEIGGDTISGLVSEARKPIKSVSVRLYSGGKLVATDQTNNDGRFTIHDLSPGKYTLSVTGWGSTTVRINPERDRPFLPQHPAWTISLSDRGCVDFGMSIG